MSEEPQEKQYLLTADARLMALITNVIPGLKFIQVEGMSIPENDLYQILVNPVAKIVVDKVGGEEVEDADGV